MWGKLLILVMLLAGIATWIQKDPLTQADRARADELPDAEEVRQDDQPFVGEGIIVRYQSADTPIYYLLYETQRHRFVRKELRFTDERGCVATSGDLPCVYPAGPSGIPVPIGSHVRVSGILDAQRIRVESLDVVPDSDRDFELRTLTIGESFTSEDTRVRLLEVYSGGPCEVFLGCYREGIPRVRYTVQVEDGGEEELMVPGMIEDTPGGAVLLLWADEVLGRATFVIAHGAAR